MFSVMQANVTAFQKVSNKYKSYADEENDENDGQQESTFERKMKEAKRCSVIICTSPSRKNT